MKMIAIHPLITEYLDIELAQRDREIANLKEIIGRQDELLRNREQLIEEMEERIVSQGREITQMKGIMKGIERLIARLEETWNTQNTST